MEIPLRVEVLPFDLDKPMVRYSIYYRGKLRKSGAGSIGSEWKSPEQYLAEMRDLKAHGVEYPTSYQAYDKELLIKAFDIRRRAGLPTGPLYTLAIGTGDPTTPEALTGLKQAVGQWLATAKELGCDELYIYGRDEAVEEKLKSQRAAWAAVHEAGGKVFVACSTGTFEAMGDLLDLAVHDTYPNPANAAKFHSAGHQIFCYAHPQVGPELPQSFRRNYGLVLWKADYDGAMPYAYQHGFGDIYVDDDSGYRDHVFAYPTVDGVIDTVQWAGFREGVDDVRYVTTLMSTIKQAKKNPAKTADADQAERWLDQLDINRDLDVVRREIVARIRRLCE